VMDDAKPRAHLSEDAPGLSRGRVRSLQEEQQTCPSMSTQSHFHVLARSACQEEQVPAPCACQTNTQMMHEDCVR
jgi:hypothetical protein